MIDIRIQSWTTRADYPNQTEVVAAVCVPINGVTKTETYELVIPGQFEVVTSEMIGVVRDILQTAGVVPSTQPPNNET